jgi:hypothetical protein
MKLCASCQNVYVMKLTEDGKLFWNCLSCGIQEEQKGGCLLNETLVQERSSEGYKILLNEFTRQDPTLPHIKNVKCSNEGCPTNTNARERDVIYIKYDAVNMKYMYICTVCNTAWRSR